MHYVQASKTNIKSPSPFRERAGVRMSGRWRRYSRKGYAIFQSLGREVVIGVLAVAMLSTQQVTARTLRPVTDFERDIVLEDSLAEVTVTGTMTPLTEMQQARIVNVITREEINRAPAATINDLLKSVAGVDVRQRGGFSMQTDISVDGGTFDQVTILLNGINITNPQTGHHTMDLPVNPCDIERIEILEGAASRVYGSSAFGGAINIVTKPGGEGILDASLSAHGGSWGTVGGSGSLDYDGSFGFHYLTGGGERSDGGTTNSDFRRSNLFYSGKADIGRHTLSWQGGLAYKQYGANTFYSARYPNQWEANRRYFASLRGDFELGAVKLRPVVYWNRNTDHFQLIRGTSTGENFHISDVCAASLTGNLRWVAGKTAVAVQLRHERILSTNLGRKYAAPKSRYACHDERTQCDISLEHNLLLEHWTFSAGLLASMLIDGANGSRTSVLQSTVCPGIDVSYRPDSHWKLFASYNKGFRLPTFTDLYYSGAERQGNGALKAEETHSFSLGARHRTAWSNASARIFCHRGRHMIDWVKYAATDPVFYAADFRLDNLGLQLQAGFDIPFPSLYKQPTNSYLHLNLAYTYIHQRRHDKRPVYKSGYAGEYLRHKFTASLAHPVFGPLSMQWNLRVCHRVGHYELYSDAAPTGILRAYHPYAVLDAKMQCQLKHCKLFLSAENLTNHSYYDFGNIPQPGACVMLGVEIGIKNIITCWLN